MILKDCSSATRRKQCHGRVIVQEYKTSNRIGTDQRTAENVGQSCKNDDRHTYDKRNTDTATERDLPELEKSDTETRGTMLNVTEWTDS